MALPTNNDLSKDLYTLKGEMQSESRAMRDRMEKLELVVKEGFKSLQDEISGFKVAEGERSGVRKTALAAWTMAAGVIGSVLTAIISHIWK